MREAQAYETVQQAQAQAVIGKKSTCRCAGCQAERSSKSKRKEQEQDPAVDQLVMSSDGAMVPMVGGEWAEVKTMVIGEFEPGKEAGEEVKTGKLSYFARLTDAETFGELVVVETERRGMVQAKEVCAVQDGALWLAGLVDLHRPDAVRILDCCRTPPSIWPTSSRH